MFTHNKKYERARARLFLPQRLLRARRFISSFRVSLEDAIERARAIRELLVRIVGSVWKTHRNRFVLMRCVNSTRSRLKQNWLIGFKTFRFALKQRGNDDAQGTYYKGKVMFGVDDCIFEYAAVISHSSFLLQFMVLCFFKCRLWSSLYIRICFLYWRRYHYHTTLKNCV